MQGNIIGELAPGTGILNMANRHNVVPIWAGTPSMVPGRHYSALSRIMLILQQATPLVAIPASLKLLRRVPCAYGQHRQNHSTAKKQHFIHTGAWGKTW